MLINEMNAIRSDIRGRCDLVSVRCIGTGWREDLACYMREYRTIFCKRYRDLAVVTPPALVPEINPSPMTTAPGHLKIAPEYPYVSFSPHEIAIRLGDITLGALHMRYNPSISQVISMKTSYFAYQASCIATLVNNPS